MSALLACIGCDLRLQIRRGFYVASGFVLLIYALARPALALLDLRWLLPALVINNQVITGFYFVAGLLLLERAEGTPAAQAVTPLRVGSYLNGKLLTLLGLAVLSTLLEALILVGPGFAMLPLLAGVVVSAGLYILAGIITVTRYDSINSLLLPSTLPVGFLMLPLFAYVAEWANWLLYLHPMWPALLLVRASIEPLASWQLWYALLYGGLWLMLGWLAARWALLRFFARSVGGR